MVAKSDVVGDGSGDTVNAATVEEKFAAALHLIPQMGEVLKDDLVDCAFSLVKLLWKEDLLLELGAHVDVALLLNFGLLP